MLKKFKPDFDKLKNIKSISLLIVPDHSGVKAKSHKLSIQKIAAIIIAYSFVVFFLSYLILAFTPLGSLMNVSGSSLSKDDIAQVKTLNERMIFLARELEKMKSTNEKLRYAIFLGDSTAVDSLTRPNSIKRGERSALQTKNKTGGDVFSVFKELFFNKNILQVKETLFSKPVNGFISRGFEPDKGHFGIDFVVKTGTPVYAASGGYVVFADYTVRDGYIIIINSPGDYVTVYKHCSALMKKSRDIVNEGELIALTGNTGEITTGPHLHFEIWKNGQPINPKTLLINY